MFLPVVGNEYQMLGTLFGVRGQDSLLPVSASCPAKLAPSPAFRSPVFLFQVPAIEENLVGDKHLLKPWDAKKVCKGHWVFLTISLLLFPWDSLFRIPNEVCHF